jgi:hypothetical protein
MQPKYCKQKSLLVENIILNHLKLKKSEIYQSNKEMLVKSHRNFTSKPPITERDVFKS